MIYVKKRTFLKRIKNKISNLTIKKEKTDISFFICFVKNIFKLFVFLFALFYLCYLFLLPKVVNEANVEKALNNYLSKNSKLILDIDNLKISPNYKFDVCIKADKVKLKYNQKSDFLVINKAKIELNFLTLFFGYIDLNNIKIDNMVMNSTFTKKQKYNSVEYLPFDFFDLKKHNSKFKIRYLKILSNNVDINIYDENIKKQFKIKAKNTKFEKKFNLINNSIFYLVTSNGAIYAPNKKINDFNLNIVYKSKEGTLKKLREILENLNYNPFIYADKYNFYCDCFVDLTINRADKKNNLLGQIKLKDLSFQVNDIKLPKNNLLIECKNDKIYSNFNFNLTNNQFIKVKTNANISKNKFIELNLNSNDINLSDLHEIISSLSKILNLKFNFYDLELKGLLNVNLYIKSNFKKITSNGSLKLHSASIKHKKLNLSLDKITSDINLKDDKINIINTSAYFDKSKFNISGQIDKNTNLNIDINSDLINFAQFFKFISSLPLISKTGLNLNDYLFKSGYLKINSKIKGTINNPIIESSSNLKNLSLFVKSLKTNLDVEEIKITPIISQNKFQYALIETDKINLKYDKFNLKSQKIKFKVSEKEIEILKSNIFLNGTDALFEGNIKDYISNNPLINLKIEALLNKRNELIIVENIKNPKLNLDLTIKNNIIHLNNCSILNTDKKIASIYGEIINFKEKIPTLNKIKILTNEKIFLILPLLDRTSLDFSANLELDGKLNNPKINGILNLNNLNCPKMEVSIKDAILNLKDSNCYINIQNGKFFGFNFDVVLQAKYKNNKIIVDWANISSNYLDFNKIEKYFNNNTLISKNDIEISNIKGNISTLVFADLSLNNAIFEGDYKDKNLNLSKFSAEIFNGKIQGNIKTNIKSQKTNANLILKELNVRLIQGLLKDLSIAASGKLSALINADFTGFSYDDIIKTLDGYIKFNINDGELAQFAKLERFLQAGNILSQSILKLTLNSTLSAISKQNTGYFKTIEGTIKIKDTWANVQYLKSQGINMSLYLEGRFNLLTKYAQMTILGRIPSNIVNVLGNVGSFNTQSLVDKMSDDTKEFVNSITVSPLEKMLTIRVLESDIEKIPPLIYKSENTTTREFFVKINGRGDSINSIQTFKWVIKQ